MQPISEHYKYDSEHGLDEGVKQYLDHATLKNLDQKNPKVLVVFSGGNAMGKSTISKRIEEQFGGLILENDGIKRCILKRWPAMSRDELNKITWQYSMHLYRHLDEFTGNGLIVRDGVIDWYYDRILPIFAEQKYRLFIIGFDVSRDKAVELIKKRGDTPTVKEERFYQLLDDHAIHTKRFRSAYAPTVVLNDDMLFDHHLVTEKLRQTMKDQAW